MHKQNGQAPDYRIVEFQPAFTGQVKSVITRVLIDQKVIEDRGQTIDDEDLDEIQQIYSGNGSL